MELKIAFLVLIPLFATCGSVENHGLTSSGARYNQGNIPNSALRPWGTVPSPITNHGNPTVRTTLSPWRPFGTVPSPLGYNPQYRPRYPITTPYPVYSYGYRSAVRSDPGVTLHPLSPRSGTADSEPVTLPPTFATERIRSGERERGSSPRLYPSLAYFDRNGNPGRGEDQVATTTLPSAVVDGIQ